jgi:hypothetical protein
MVQIWIFASGQPPRHLSIPTTFVLYIYPKCSQKIVYVVHEVFRTSCCKHQFKNVVELYVVFPFHSIWEWFDLKRCCVSIHLCLQYKYERAY